MVRGADYYSCSPFTPALQFNYLLSPTFKNEHKNNEQGS